MMNKLINKIAQRQVNSISAICMTRTSLQTKLFYVKWKVFELCSAPGQVYKQRNFSAQ